MMVVSILRGPQDKPQNTIIPSIGTPKIVSLILGNPPYNPPGSSQELVLLFFSKHRGVIPAKVLGVPNDMGTQYRSGARMGPRGIRESSTLYQFGHKEVYDADTDETYEYGNVIDIGDVDIVHTDQAFQGRRGFRK